MLTGGNHAPSVNGGVSAGRRAGGRNNAAAGPVPGMYAGRKGVNTGPAPDWNATKLHKEKA